MTLVLRNLLHDRGRTAVGIVGVAFAVFLMVFQGALLVGFVQAAGRLVTTSDGEVWVGGRGTPCFQYGPPIDERFRDLVRATPGVRGVARVALGFTQWKTTGGATLTVFLAGADPEIGPAFPLPYASAERGTLRPEAVLFPESDRRLLELASLPLPVEIAGCRATALRSVAGHGSFLGCPTVFASLEDGRRYLGMTSDEATFLALDLAPGADPAAVRRSIAAKFPELDAWTKDELAWLTARYWLLETGAGGGILMAGLLGFAVGTLIVSQTVYAATLDRIEEYATLKAIGASDAFLRRTVGAQALASGALGWLAGVAIAFPATWAAVRLIPWIAPPGPLAAAVLVPTAAMSLLASIASIRRVTRVEPARVFRA